MTPNDPSGNGHGRRPRRHRYLTPWQRRWRMIRPVIKWVSRIGVLGLVAATAAFLWSFTPAPSSASISKYLTLETVQELPHHRYTFSTTASSDSYIELIVEQPQDSYFAPDANVSFPYGWYGRAACLLVADNLFGHQVIAYGVVADFIIIRGGLKVWVPAQVLASTATGWHIQPSIGEQLAYDAQSSTFSISASADITLFNQVNAPLRDYAFSVRLSIGAGGTFQCSVDTSILSTGPPLVWQR